MIKKKQQEKQTKFTPRRSSPSDDSRLKQIVSTIGIFWLPIVVALLLAGYVFEKLTGKSDD